LLDNNVEVINNCCIVSAVPTTEATEATASVDF